MVWKLKILTLSHRKVLVPEVSLKIFYGEPILSPEIQQWNFYRQAITKIMALTTNFTGK